VFLAEVQHRAAYITRKLYKRKLLRKARRGRHCRYRKPRPSRKPTAVPPSIRHRLENIATWVRRLRAWAPVGNIVWEEVGFDPPPDLRRPNQERRQSLRERLASRHGRACAYCGRSVGPLEADHVRPKSRGGSDGIDNRLLTCRRCNECKGVRSAKDFMGERDRPPPRKRLAGLSDAAAVNRMRRALAEMLRAQGLPAQAANTRHTAANRVALGLVKRDAIDALALGKGLRRVKGAQMPVLEIKSMGRGSRVRVRNDKHGFPRGNVTAGKRVMGFGTGDLVRVMPKFGQAGKGVIGRVAVRGCGDFNVRPAGGMLRAQASRCVLVQRCDGYGYRLDLDGG
jgi:hypothetical protein